MPITPIPLLAMSHDVKVPAAGESVTSATIGRWHKKDGDRVRKGEVVATLETDKVSQELEAEVEGVLRTLAAEGDDVAVGAVIATIEEANKDAAAAAPAPAQAPAPAPAPAPTPAPAPAPAPVPV